MQDSPIQQDASVQLDDDANELYQQLEGIKKVELSDFAPLDADQLAKSLREEEKKFDAWRITLGKLVYLISSYFHLVTTSAGTDKEKALFIQLQKIFNKFKA